MAAFPTTAQKALDRLLVDRPFLIQTVVNDNFPAVRKRYLELLQDNPGRVNTPQRLTQELTWWLQNDPNAVDKVLEVPWKNTLGSQVLNEAFVELQNRASSTAGGEKFLGSLITSVLALTGSNAQAEAMAAAQAAAAAEAARQEAERKAANARFLRIAGVVLLIMAIIAFIIYIRRR